MLTAHVLRSRYGRIGALHGIDLTVNSGAIVTVAGANGAGKTTLLRCLSGVQPASRTRQSIFRCVRGRDGLRWRDVPASYGLHKIIYNRFIRYLTGDCRQSPRGRGSEMGVFGRIFVELAKGGGDRQEIRIDAPPLKAQRTAASLLKKEALPGRVGRMKGGLNANPHAVCDSEGRPRTLPPAKALLGDKGHDAERFQEALAGREYKVCIPWKSNRKIQIPHDKALCRKRHKIENMFGQLKD